MRRAFLPQHHADGAAALVEVLQRLYQTKLRSGLFLAQWLRDTHDAEIRAGLETQLADERRHARLLGDELRRLAPKLDLVGQSAASRPFSEFGELRSDLHKLCAFHRGVKAFTLNRCGHLTPLVEPRLSLLLDQIAREEERHIRWADIRLARLLTHEEMRACNLLMGRVWAILEAGWERTWRDLMRHQRDLPAQLS
jgi:hypothetical protein